MLQMLSIEFFRNVIWLLKATHSHQLHVSLLRMLVTLKCKLLVFQSCASLLSKEIIMNAKSYYTLWK